MARKPPTDRELAYRGGWARLSKFVIARDKGVCWICHLPGADTADHLDPVSEHGPGLPPPDRLRAAHRSCNSRRARLAEQEARRQPGASADDLDDLGREIPRLERERRRRPARRLPRAWEGALTGLTYSQPTEVIDSDGFVRIEPGRKG
jgi:hypothetical protein